MGTPLRDLNPISMSTSNQSRSLLLHFLSLSILFFHSSSSSPIPYSPHCSHIVPESTRSDPHTPSPSFLQLSNAYAANADQLIGPSASQINAHFKPISVFRTQTPQILQIDGTLQLRVSRVWGFSKNATGRRLYRVYGGPQPFRFGRAVDFQLSGFWSSSGRLCMVGSGHLKSLIHGKDLSFNVVFKLNYPNNSVIARSLVSGRLESLDSEGADGFFRPITVLDFSRMNYEFSLIKDEIGKNYAAKSRGSLHKSNRDCFSLTSLSDKFEIEYGGSCQGNNCTLPHRLFGYLPKYMSVNVIDCSADPFVRFSLEFSNSSSIKNGFMQPFDPGSTLVAEGVWNENRNQLSAVACSILMNSSGSASVGDCSVRLNFTLASMLSIRWRSLIDGQMWSNKSGVDVGYFDKFEIRTSIPRLWPLPGLRYEYTEIERAKRYCSESNATKNKGTNYPDAYSSDMKFDMEVKNDKKQITWGVVVPIFVDDHSVLDGYSSRFPTIKHLGTLNHGGLVNNTHSDLMNISYSVMLNSMYKFELGGKRILKKVNYISAEGIYDTRTGLLCMVGCWTRNEAHEEQVYNSSAHVDCEIFIKIQFPHGTNGMPKGTIESKRQRTDPLYFEQLSFTATSITERQADRSVWRMDLEITMVLISNTLACVFLGLQLLHVKNCPEVLPFISVVMLVVLTLGHMVPLMLNFDAFLSNRKRQNVLLASGDWLEINEIVVRAITMIAFLLEARLLQLTWSSRSGNENQNHLWASEKKVLYLSLPLCLFGALIAWFLHPWKSLPKTSFWHPRHQRISRWRDLKAYAGLVLDAFLFPQIVFNIFCGSKENALARPYYVGTTVVRMLPHAYDLFRAHSSALKLDLWYIYANPRMNFYSTSWDIFISVCCLLFAVLIYLQQRFGGCWVLPSRLRERYAYEKVPVAIADSK